MNLLHILNGDGTQSPFSQSAVPGEALVWREILCEGPLGLFEDLEELIQIREPFLQNEFEAGPNDYEEKVAQVWRQLPFPKKDQEIVLWFEHDLFCQVNLLYLAHLLYKRGFETISVVSPNSHPEVPDFRGMGQLLPEHFPPLFAQRRTLGLESLLMAHNVWQALASPTPQALLEMELSQSPDWPHLQVALELHFQLFPSVQTGLNQVETWLLKQFSTGPKEKGPLFQAFCQDWNGLGWGDLQFFKLVDRLSGLVHGSEEGHALTAVGEQVLSGQRDRFEALSAPVQIGNVRCNGQGAEWRWDQDRKTLVLTT